MDYKQHLKESVRYRVKNIGLTESQFREMVDKNLTLECKGIYCSMYADYTPDKGLFWDTESFDTRGLYAPYSLRHHLILSAEQYIRKLPAFRGDIHSFISIEPRYGRYLPKNIRRQLSKAEYAEYMSL